MAGQRERCRETWCVGFRLKRDLRAPESAAAPSLSRNHFVREPKRGHLRALWWTSWESNPEPSD